MLKAEIIKENAVIKEQVRLLRQEDENMREHISGFLGSYKKDRWSQENEIKTLPWEEIYFEIGKLIKSQEVQEEIYKLRSIVRELEKNLNDMYTKAEQEKLNITK